MHKKSLVLITDGFPYGKGEKPFIVPELSYLMREYEVTILAITTHEVASVTADVTPLPEGVRLVTFYSPTKLVLCFRALGIPFSTLGRRELRGLTRDGITLGRMKQSLRTYANASAIRSFMTKKGLFEHLESTVFYSFWLSNGCLAVTLEKAQSPSVRLVSRVHGYDLYEDRNGPARQPFQRIMADACDRILFISEQGLRYFGERFGHERHLGQYVLNYLGINLPHTLNPARSGPSKLRIVSCSNVIEVKRVCLLAEALAVLPSSKFEWVHFGDGSLLEEVRDYAIEHGIDARFVGHVANGEVLAYYATEHVDVFVNVSRSEGLPVSLMEAAAYGIPLIATDVGGSGEVIDGNGVLLPSNPSANQVAQAISLLLSFDSEDAETIRQRSRDLIEGRFELSSRKEELLEELGRI